MVTDTSLPVILDSRLACLTPLESWGGGSPAATRLTPEALRPRTAWRSRDPRSWVAVSKAAILLSRSSILSSLLLIFHNRAVILPPA